MGAEIARVFRHALVYGVASVTSKFVGFLMIPIYTRYLSPKDYGVLELLDLSSNVVGIVLSLGFSAAVLRFYFQYDAEEDRRQVVSTALLATITLAAGATVLLLTQTAELARLILGRPGHARLVGIMILTSSLGITLIVPLAYVRALSRSVLYGGIAIGRLVLGLALNVFFVVILRMGVLGVMLSGLIVAVISSLGLVAGTLSTVRMRLSRAKLAEMLAYGGPLVPASLSMFVLHFADRFFLQRLADLEQVGLYALGYKFAMMLPVLVMEPFGLVWGAAVFAIAKRDDAPRIYARVFTYFFLAATFFALGVSVLIKDVLRVIATPQFLAAHTVVPIIMAGLLCLAASQFFETGVHLAKRTMFRAVAVGSAASANLLLNVLLIPRHGMMGAAAATLISFAVLAALSYVFGQRLYYIPYEFVRLVKLLAAAAIIYWASTWLDIGSLGASTGIRLALVLLYPVLLYMSTFCERDELAKVTHAGQRAAASVWGWLHHARSAL